MAGTKWYYQDPGTEERAGPVTVEFIRNLFETGVVLEDTLVWCKGMVNWEPVHSVPIFITPLERDLKEYFTPGKGKESRERDVEQMKSFNEGWYFIDEENTTHGPVFKEDLVEVIKAAADWDTQVWNVNVLVDYEDGERFKFSEVFPEQVGKSSIYEVEKLEEQVQKLDGRVTETEVEPELAAISAGNSSSSSSPRQSTSERLGDASISSPESLDMMLIQQAMQNASQKSQKVKEEKEEVEVEEVADIIPQRNGSSSSSHVDESKQSKVTGSLRNLLQDAEALLAKATPRKDAAKAATNDRSEAPEQVIVMRKNSCLYRLPLYFAC